MARAFGRQVEQTGNCFARTDRERWGLLWRLRRRGRWNAGIGERALGAGEIAGLRALGVDAKDRLPKESVSRFSPSNLPTFRSECAAPVKRRRG